MLGRIVSKHGRVRTLNLNSFTRNLGAPVCRAVNFSASPVGMNIFQRSSQAGSILTNKIVQYRCFSDSGETVVIPVPSMGDSITEGSINHWKKKVGMEVAADEVVAVIDTDKVSVDIISPHAGVITEICSNDGDIVLVGSPLFSIAKGMKSTLTQSVETVAPAVSTPASFTPAPAVSTPATPPPSATPAPSKPVQAAPAKSSDLRGEKRVTMSRLRLRIAERLKDAQNTSAMLTTFNECDMSSLMALRKELNDSFQEKHGVKMGFVSAFMMAATLSLKKMPEINAYIDGKEIIFKDHVDISVAVATPNGLMVPVVRDCQNKSWADLESDLVALAAKARKGQIALEDMVGGTFTVSNGGVYGSMMGTPILNSPQSSILGMHAVTKRAVVRDDQIVIRPIMYLALTYDHRLIDGREAVTFLCSIRDYIENPKKMILGL